MTDYQRTEQDIYEQAAAWLEKLSAGELDSLSKRRFSHWLGADPKHRTVLVAMVETWNDPALNLVLARYPSRSPGRLQAAWSQFGLATAAAFVMVLLAGGYWSLARQPAVTPYELRTAKAESAQQQLADGSVLEMAPDTQLTVNFSSARRQVVQGLGAAYFSVEKDQQRPFEVRLGQASVVAVGTEFTIDQDPDLIDITVYEGAVQVQASAAGPNLLLKAGEQVRISNQQLSEVRKVDLQQLVDWRSGWIEIENESLAYLLHRLNRSGNTEISATPELRQLRVAGRFELANISQTLQALQQTYDLQLESSPQGIRLVRSP
ncbi:FecR domain-containing protein [Rheinheimera sp.]|uniref:FecR family protein n=1 Tax=Rheinheimera sp. TaxID=1869214 RepID=UPI00307D7C65